MEPQSTGENLDEQNPFLLSETIPARDDETIIQNMKMAHIPQYVEPETCAGEFDTTVLWVPEHDHEYNIRVGGNEYTISVETKMEGKAYVQPDVTVDSLDDEMCSLLFWTCVHLCRHIGIPGVAKECILWNENQYRIGGLYRYAGFVLLEREWDYHTYGERHITEYENGLSQFHGDVGGDEETEKQKQTARDRYGSYTLRDPHSSNSHAQSILRAGDSNE